MTEDPVFPMFIYIYDTDGRYGEPVQINSEAQLHGPGTKMMLKIAMEQGVEIRITDPGDLMLFHAHHGRILFGGGAKQRDSVGCFHQLEHIDEPPFRYRCKLCGKKLKIASGVYPPKKKGTK